MLVLLDQILPNALAAASSVARAWRDVGNPPPMTMTVREWRRSVDVFPMEYADILDQHQVLFGAPPFDGIVVSREELRHQLEQEVMGKLLQLRQGALIVGTDGKLQTELIAKSFSTIMVLLRAFIRLVGDTPTGDNAAIATRVSHIAGCDPSAFTRSAEHHRGASRIAPADAGAVLAGLLSGLERIDAFLDSFNL